MQGVKSGGSGARSGGLGIELKLETRGQHEALSETSRCLLLRLREHGTQP